MDKLISIVTAHINDYERLKKTRDSINSQNRDFFEWIIIDGESKKIREYKLKKILDESDFFISEKDKGIADAWNKGIKASKGKYILLLNCGDTLMPDFIKNFQWLREARPMIHSYHAVLTSGQKPLRFLRVKPKKLIFAMSIPHNFTFVPAKFYKDFGLYSEIKLSMDYEWFLRNLFKNNLLNQIEIHNEIAGFYPLGGLSDKFAYQSFLKNLKLQIKHLPISYSILSLLNFLFAVLKHFLVNLLNKFI